MAGLRKEKNLLFIAEALCFMLDNWEKVLYCNINILVRESIIITHMIVCVIDNTQMMN